ncbi:MAG TPA: Gfo/Idh/MocA family oxidoreductase [Candidatus Sulfotelmatobacter sp.]|jgi:predicted dehydrogenase
MTPFRVAVLGSGAVTNVLYRSALQEIREEIELVGLADLNQPSAEQLLHDFPSAKFFTDYHAMLEQLHPDAVIVALPHFLHRPASIDALRMGIHVFCEKPMAISAAECNEIEAAVRETGAIFCVNLLRRWFPSVQEIKRMVDARALGALTSFEATEGAPYGWPAMSFSFFDRKISGGGVLMDSGVHTLDLLQWWLGPIEVVEYLDDAAPNGVECDCVAELRVGGAQGSLRMSRSVELPNMYQLQFERGWIEWDHDDATQFRFSSDGKTTVEATVRCGARWASGSRFTFALAQQLRSFARACCGESPAGLVLAGEARKSVDIITNCYSRRKELVIAGE